MRSLLALVAAGMVAFSGVNASSSAAQTAPAEEQKSAAAMGADGTVEAVRNSSPLPPGKAAGIRPAQGQGETIWHIIGLGFIGGVVVAMILIDGEDADGAVTTTN